MLERDPIAERLNQVELSAKTLRAFYVVHGRIDEGDFREMYRYAAELWYRVDQWMDGRLGEQPHA